MTLKPRPKLSDLAHDCWDRLEAAVTDRGSAFRTPAVASSGASGPEVRTVVLRAAKAAQRQLTFHTHKQSPKALQLAKAPCLSWLFYDAQRREQLRAWSETSLHHQDAVSRALWASSHPSTLLDFASPAAPGRRLESGDEPNTPPSSDSEQFLVVVCTVHRLDWLALRTGEHWRAGFQWSGDAWHGEWLVP